MLIFRSEKFKSIIKKLDHTAQFRSSILLLGESGVGKEEMAKRIHGKSPQKNFPFMAVNCGALPEQILESTLFGHKKGSFTGAIRDKKGFVEDAEGGSIFLDEIADTSLAIQVKLLRFLGTGEYQVLGDTSTKTANIRIISATNKNLAKEVKEGRFREDLLYRLNVIPIFIPPLRERVEDIIPIAEHYLKKFCDENKIEKIPTFDNNAITRLIEYDWPGNIRELQNIVERVVILSSGKFIDGETISNSIKMDPKYTENEAKTIISTENGNNPYEKFPNNKSLKARIEPAEKLEIQNELNINNRNISATAKTLGISRPTLYKKLKKYDIPIN